MESPGLRATWKSRKDEDMTKYSCLCESTGGVRQLELPSSRSVDDATSIQLPPCVINQGAPNSHYFSLYYLTPL